MTYIIDTLNDLASSGRRDLYMNILRKHGELQSADISINNKCNLDCLHCSHNISSNGYPEMSLTKWIEVVRELIDLGVQYLHICGKEPFLSPWLPEFLYAIDQLKRKKPFRYGLVTNGTLLKHNLGWLSKSSIDYIDVSIDGLQEGHDFLRDQGSFYHVAEQIRLAVKILGKDRVNLATVLCSHNTKEIPGMINFFHKMGIRYFFIQPVQMVGKAREKPCLKVSEKAFLEFIEHLISGKGDGKVLIEIFVDYKYKNYLFNSNKLFRQSCKEKSLGKSLAFHIPMGELQFTFNWVCYAYWKSCMITPFGEFLGCSAQATEPKSIGPRIGFVTDHSIADLFAKSLKKECLGVFHFPRSGRGRKQEIRKAGINWCPIAQMVQNKTEMR